MRTVILTIAVVATLSNLSSADDPKADAVRQDTEKLQGTWKVVSQSDARDTPDNLKTQQVVVQGPSITLVKKAFNNNWELTIDPSTNPKQIDMMITEGSSKGKIIQGIYEVEGDDLKLCYFITAINKNRPSEFKGDFDKGHRLLILKREKP